MTSDGSSISVVMPLYNGRSYVGEALQSVLDQSVLPGEVIVVDDGSTDASHEVIDSIESPIPVKIIRQSNRGQAAARNVGVSVANGEFVAFIDQDDGWRRGHLEALLRAISKDPDIAWAYSDFDEIDTQGRTVTHSFIREQGLVHPKRTLAACLAADLMVIPSASMLRKEALVGVGGFYEELSGYEDDELFVRIFRAGWNHVFVDKPLTRFRVHGSDSSSSSSWRFLDSRMTYLDRLIESVIDDDRLNRYWVRDLVLPRFFVTTVDDYSRALSRMEWEQAERAAEAAKRMASMMPPRLRRRIEMRVMSNPKACRRALLVLNRMPARVQRLVNPTLRIRPTSRYAN